DPALLSRVPMARPWNDQVHEERLAGRPVLGFLRDLDRRIYGRSGGVPDGGYGIGDRPLGKENLPRGLGIEIQQRRSLAETGAYKSGQCRRDEKRGTRCQSSRPLNRAEPIWNQINYSDVHAI